MKDNKGINEVIKEYPLVAKFLSYNDIDCITCSIGTCHLENVLDVHNFSKEDQVKMYEYMNKLISNETTEMKKFIPEVKAKKVARITNILMEEHIYIKELLYVLEYITTKKNFLKQYKEQINQILNYIKIFADELHHLKEEKLLFVLFKDNEVVELMLEEHDVGRSFRKIIISSEDENVVKEAIKNLTSLLKDHIRKEDDILFPYLDKKLSKEQIESIDEYLKSQNKDLQEEVKKYLHDFNAKEFNM